MNKSGAVVHHSPMRSVEPRVESSPGTPQLELRVEEKEIILEHALDGKAGFGRETLDSVEEQNKGSGGESAVGTAEMRRKQTPPLSSPVVPVLNLSALHEKHQAMEQISMEEKKKTYSDSKLMNEAQKRKEVESFKLKMKEQQAEKAWDKLTTANLQAFVKSHEPGGRQQSLARVRKWVEESVPPYDTNPSPGVSALTAPSRQESKTGRFNLCGCFGL